LRALLAQARDRLGPADDLSLKIQSKLAYTLGVANDFDAAIPLAREALALTEQAHGQNHFLVLDRKFHLAEVLIEDGQGEEPARLLGEIRGAALAMSGGETQFSARCANQLGFAYSNLKRYDDSVRYFRLALDYNVRVHGEGFSMSREILNNIASMYAFAGRNQEAVAAGEKVLALERAPGRPAGGCRGDLSRRAGAGAAGLSAWRVGPGAFRVPFGRGAGRGTEV
jgi:tetratricopeptide (TPR) repeat protein